MWQNLIVAVAFVAAAAWVTWNVLLPDTVRAHIRSGFGAPPAAKPHSCGGCCGGCGSDKPPAPGT